MGCFIVQLTMSKIFKIKIRIKLKTYQNFRPQLTVEPEWFERGVKEAIYIRLKGPALNRDGGRYNLPSVRDKRRTGRVVGGGAGLRASKQLHNLSTLCAGHVTCQRRSEQDSR